ncbi:MAG: App1 family protein [Thiohalospira sp.]
MKYLKPIFRKIVNPFKRVKIYIKHKAGWLDVPKIIPYRGYGNQTEVFIEGMVIEDKGLAKPQDKHKFWHNILATIKRFSSDEIAGVNVRAIFLGETKVCETDALGFFSFHFNINNKLKQIKYNTWYSVDFELIDNVIEDQKTIVAKGEVMIISPKIQRIIISDIDDTVLVSHSTQTMKKLQLMLFKNALTRNPFPGITKFYTALSKGKDDTSDIPFFYVSSSEWNLYDLLEDFFYANELPKGIFLLRKLEYSIYKFWKSGGGSHQHKYNKIKRILELFPDQKVILIGDSGQKDPWIYSDIALEYPGRIETIYIRKIRSRSLFQQEQNIFEKLQNIETEYLEFESALSALEHSKIKGFVSSV